MQYMVIEAKDDAQELDEAVNQQIEEGWEPLGGVAVGYSTDSGNWWFYQAMVKRSPK